MHEELKTELAAAIDKVLSSEHPRKVLVAGPGAGKTSLFKRLLAKSRDIKADAKHLVVTFINDLTAELRRDLGDLANVQTFHGYCAQALHRNEYLREGLSEDFGIYPKLPSIVKSDWEILHPAVETPRFVDLMRRTVDNDATVFYMDRSNYYDSVGFDDMVFRVFRQLDRNPQAAEAHDLVLVDEYQDFNLLEVSLLDILGRKSKVVFAGDDDQVLYGALRGSSWNFIRDLHTSDETECCELPFCMRCPEAIVGATNEVVQKAIADGHLTGRIAKSFRYYPPVKEADSAAHPRLVVVRTSTQTTKANYFGRFVEKLATSMPANEITQAREGGYPSILVIGNIQYLRQISEHLRWNGYVLDERDPSASGIDEIRRHDGLMRLKSDPASRLGWRIVLEADQPEFWSELAPTALVAPNLVELLPAEYRDAVLADAAAVTEPDAAAEPPEVPANQPAIKLTSYQGAKGLSAQYVVLAGIHNVDLPRNPNAITDIEICKFLVALTRTRKRCFLLYTTRFANRPTQPSVFISWISANRKEQLYIDRNYWGNAAAS